MRCIGNCPQPSQLAPALNHRQLRSFRSLHFRLNKTLLLLVINVGAIVPAFGTCTAPRNPIEAENCLPGTPSSVWYIADAGSPNIQGFTTDISVNVGQSLFFKIHTSALAYRIDVYRIGFYQGNGARLVATVLPSAPLPQTQPTCLTDSAVGLTDCGNWAVSASWAVPNNATSGIYFARLVRLDTGEASPILFVVRNDASHSDILAQSSDTTWHAYNDYGGSSLYTGPISRAYKVSYNRPFNVPNGYTWFFSAEYPMVRWLEANGYDVSYSTGVDTDRRGALITQHKVFMSIGHDEYWSGGQRSSVEAARAAGVNLAFFSGNEVFWKTRWESSTDGSNTPYRTLVCYKETNADSVIDPADPPTWTGTWRDPRFSPPADGGRPENALTGTVFWVNSVRRDAITVPQADGRMRFWRNTSIASLAPGQVATLPTGVLGYEWDVDADNGFRPAGLVPLSTTTLTVSTYLLDYGHTFGTGTATHHLTLYRAPSGALVFGAGTVQWSWGLDNTHSIDNVTPIDPNMRQATVNLLADMVVQPATLQAGLVPATSSTDITPPKSTIISPASGSTVTIGSTVTVSGSALDSGGVVGAVEISVDGGKTWHRAVGRENWSYSFTVGNTGSLSIQSRAVDDSGNIEVPGPGITLVTPLSVSTTSLPNGTQSVAYNQSLAAAGGTTPYSWSLISGALPAGLSLSSGGQISGTPTTTGTSNFTVQVTDASTPVQTATRALSITIVAASGGCPCTIWPSTAVPSVADVGPDSPVELGVTFRADSNGYITGIRFYKSTGNTGTHVGNLWSSGGTLLASATFTGESASGWQQGNFSNPVAITANTFYVASYHTTIGHYSVTGNYFATTGVDNAPLHAPVNSSSTPNGPYAYGSTSTFPRNTYNSANYWVDVVFSASPH